MDNLEKYVTIEGETRNTRMGGFTDSYLFIVGKGEVKPNYTETSRTGNHGKRIWVIPKEEEPKATLVTFLISNTGKRNVVIHNAPMPEIEHIVRFQWVLMKQSTKHIVTKLDEIFRNIKL